MGASSSSTAWGGGGDTRKHGSIARHGGAQRPRAVASGDAGPMVTEFRSGQVVLTDPVATAAAVAAFKAATESAAIAAAEAALNAPLEKRSSEERGHRSVAPVVVSVIPRRFLWAKHPGNAPSPKWQREIAAQWGGRKQLHVFSTDETLTYEPYFSDFGPLNLAHTARYCRMVRERLSSERYSSHCLVHCTRANNPRTSANSAVLVALFALLVLRYPPAAIYGPQYFGPVPLCPFRDATYGVCTYAMTLADCVDAMARASQLGWFDIDTFDVAQYEEDARLPNGDIHAVIPKQVFALSGPEAEDPWQPIEAPIPLSLSPTPEMYVDIFRRLRIGLVIRLNKKQYDARVFTSRGIKHVELFLPDGSVPTPACVRKFLEICEGFATTGEAAAGKRGKDGAAPAAGIAVHCKAGLGRTGTLIGCLAIKNFGFSGREWIAWNRLCRPGSVLGPQQQFLASLSGREALLQRCAWDLALVPKPPALLRPPAAPAAGRKASDESLTDLALPPCLTPKERLVAAAGDSGQGERLLQSRRGARGRSGSRAPVWLASVPPHAPDDRLTPKLASVPPPKQRLSRKKTEPKRERLPVA